LEKLAWLYLELAAPHPNESIGKKTHNFLFPNFNCINIPNCGIPYLDTNFYFRPKVGVLRKTCAFFVQNDSLGSGAANENIAMLIFGNKKCEIKTRNNYRC